MASSPKNSLPACSAHAPFYDEGNALQMLLSSLLVCMDTEAATSIGSSAIVVDLVSPTTSWGSRGAIVASTALHDSDVSTSPRVCMLPRLTRFPVQALTVLPATSAPTTATVAAASKRQRDDDDDNGTTFALFPLNSRVMKRSATCSSTKAELRAECNPLNEAVEQEQKQKQQRQKDEEEKQEPRIPAQCRDVEKRGGCSPHMSRRKVELELPLRAAVIRRLFYSNPFQVPPTLNAVGEATDVDDFNQRAIVKEKNCREGVGGAEADMHGRLEQQQGSSTKRSSLGVSDLSALGCLFPALHAAQLFTTSEAFLAHCQDDSHTFLCESCPLIPLRDVSEHPEDASQMAPGARECIGDDVNYSFHSNAYATRQRPLLDHHHHHFYQHYDYRTHGLLSFFQLYTRISDFLSIRLSDAALGGECACWGDRTDLCGDSVPQPPRGGKDCERSSNGEEGGECSHGRDRLRSAMCAWLSFEMAEYVARHVAVARDDSGAAAASASAEAFNGSTASLTGRGERVHSVEEQQGEEKEKEGSQKNAKGCSHVSDELVTPSAASTADAASAAAGTQVPVVWFSLPSVALFLSTLLKQWWSTFIELPGGGCESSRFSSFFPSSLCGVTYKAILAKSLLHRLLGHSRASSDRSLLCDATDESVAVKLFFNELAVSLAQEYVREERVVECQKQIQEAMSLCKPEDDGSKRNTSTLVSAATTSTEQGQNKNEAADADCGGYRECMGLILSLMLADPLNRMPKSETDAKCLNYMRK